MSVRHLCFERDRFLCVLERDRERDRRDLTERLEERFFTSAGGRAAIVTRQLRESVTTNGPRCACPAGVKRGAYLALWRRRW